MSDAYRSIGSGCGLVIELKVFNSAAGRSSVRAVADERRSIRLRVFFQFLTDLLPLGSSIFEQSATLRRIFACQGL